VINLAGALNLSTADLLDGITWVPVFAPRGNFVTGEANREEG